jgi:hypothetical protein
VGITGLQLSYRGFEHKVSAVVYHHLTYLILSVMPPFNRCSEEVGSSSVQPAAPQCYAERAAHGEGVWRGMYVGE